MQIKTTRFGLIEIDDTDVVHFKDGILGFPGLSKFVLLDDPYDEIFAWLQACERPEVAFPILEPELFTSSYSLNLTKSEIEELKLNDKSKRCLFNIVTIPEDVSQMTANLKAPIVINVTARLGRQVIAAENEYSIKYPIFADLQKRLYQNPLQHLRAGTPSIKEMAVRLPTRPANTKDINA
jgi:flagellar assembly factor FliW